MRFLNQSLEIKLLAQFNQTPRTWRSELNYVKNKSFMIIKSIFLNNRNQLIWKMMILNYLKLIKK